MMKTCYKIMILDRKYSTYQQLEKRRAPGKPVPQEGITILLKLTNKHERQR